MTQTASYKPSQVGLNSHFLRRESKNAVFFPVIHPVVDILQCAEKNVYQHYVERSQRILHGTRNTIVVPTTTDQGTELVKTNQVVTW